MMSKRRGGGMGGGGGEDDELEVMIAREATRGAGESAVTGDASGVGDTEPIMAGGSERENSERAAKEARSLGGGWREFVRKSWMSFAARVGAEQNPDVAIRSCQQLMFLSVIAFSVIVLPILLADDRTDESTTGLTPDDSALLPGVEEDSTMIKKGSHGAVACDDLTCAEIAMKVMQEMGGNAADAGVAATFCEGVLAPHASGLGGGAVITYHMKESGKTGVIDARETAPSNADDRAASPGSAFSTNAIGVPGELRGLFRLHSQQGSLTWKELVAFAADLAEGSPVSRVLANRLREAQEDIVSNEQLRAVFTKPKHDKNENKDFDDDYALNMMDADYEVLQVGDTMVNHNLAKTLRKIMDEPLAMYASMSPHLARDIAGDGGVMTEDDIRNYEIHETEPLITFYQGLMVATSRLSTGGPLLAFALNFLEGYQLRKRGRNGDTFHLVIEALKYSFGFRSVLGDPDFEPSAENTVTDKMLNKEYAMKLRSEVDYARERNGSAYSVSEEGWVEDHGTSHVSIIDSKGNAVAISSSINYAFGSRYMSPSTGIIMNNALVSFSPRDSESGYLISESNLNKIAPGKRPTSSLSPTIVLRNDKPYIVTGGGGGPMGISAILQTILALIEFGDTPGQAVSQPRIHHQVDPAELRMEAIDTETCGVQKSYKRSDEGGTPGFWSEVCMSLSKKGYNITLMPTIGFAHTVWRVAAPHKFETNGNATEVENLVLACGDGRKLGAAAAY